MEGGFRELMERWWWWFGWGGVVGVRGCLGWGWWLVVFWVVFQAVVFGLRLRVVVAGRGNVNTPKILVVLYRCTKGKLHMQCLKVKLN